jgi:hypothetical protein
VFSKSTTLVGVGVVLACLIALSGCATSASRQRQVESEIAVQRLLGSGVVTPAIEDSSLGQPVIPSSECIGAVVNGVCHGTPSPEAQIGIQTGTVPRCHGQMVGGQCTGPVF